MRGFQLIELALQAGCTQAIRNRFDKALELARDVGEFAPGLGPTPSTLSAEPIQRIAEPWRQVSRVAI